MKNLIYDFRFLIYGFSIGALFNLLVTLTTDMTVWWETTWSILLMIACIPLVFALDNKFIKRKGVN